MSQEEFERFMGSAMQGVALHLLEIATNDIGAKGFETCRSGDLIHLRVRNSKDEVCLQVAGKDTIELADELVLACLQNISIKQLSALHQRPLNRPLQVAKGTE